MRAKRAAACVAIMMCLAAPAWGSDWNVANGLWSNDGSWNPAGVPNGTNAYIGWGTATLQTNAFDITTLDVVGPAFGTSQLSVLGGADLTTTGNAVIGSGALTGSEAIVSQSGGTLSLGANLTVGSDSGLGEWAMSNGTVEVANDLTIGSGIDGVFSMSDGGLTVHGGLAIADNSGLGTMTVSGGTLLQDGATDSFSVGTSGSGTLQIEGGGATINVANYEQTSSGALNLVLNDSGIAAINISGDVTLNGELNVSIAPATSPAPGVYDILIPTGTQTGGFTAVTLPAGVELRYSDDTFSTTRLYVGVEAPPVYCPVANYWGFDGNATDSAGIFPGHTSESGTHFDGGNRRIYVTLDASNNGVFDVGEQVLTTINNMAYATGDAFNDTHDTILGASYSVGFWMNMQADSHIPANSFANNTGNVPSDVFFRVWGPTGAIFSESDKSYATLTGPITATEWKYITIAHDGENDKVYVYVNGVLDPSYPPDGLDSTRSGPTGVSQFALGNSSRPYMYSGNVWYGRLSTWTEYLTPEQVVALYNNDGIPLNFLEAGGPDPAAVPEPGSLVLCLLGCAGLVRRRRK